MSLSWILIIALIAFTLPVLFCISKSDSYADFVAAIDPKQFSGSKYFGVGFAAIDLVKVDFKASGVHKIREQATVLFGRKYADFYVRVLYAQAFTYSMLLMYAMLFLSCLIGRSDGLLFAIIGAVASFATYKFYLGSFSSKIEKLNVIYMRDFPNAISTIALLVNGGMFLRDAWKQVAYSSEEPLYMQMRGVVTDMNNGVSEADAIFAFANRCSTKEIRKFSTLITQAIEKGGRDLADSLVKESDLLINAKRQMVLQQGEKASNKLMIPIAMILIGILVMIMVPIMANMGI